MDVYTSHNIRIAVLAVIAVLAWTGSAFAATADADSTKGKEAQQSLSLSSSQSDGQTDKTPQKKQGQTTGSGAVLRMIFGLIIVVATILAVWKALKWYARQQSIERTRSGMEGYIDILATTMLSPGRRVHVIRVGSQTVLVGETEHAITQIATIDSGTTVQTESPFRHMPMANTFDGLIAEKLSVEDHREVRQGSAVKKLLDGLRDATAR